MTLEEDIAQKIDLYSMQAQQRLRQLLLEKGRPDLLAQFDAKMKDIRLGIDGARGCWHALSEAQRRALRFASSSGFALYRYGPNSYGSVADKTPPLGIRLATVRNLIARELLACDGGAFDPEKVLVLTERGRFVLKHGPQAPSGGRNR